MPKHPALPKFAELLRRSKALACLDAILCDEFDGRYYSFNSKWAPKQEMASMRNGSGDEWFMLFDSRGWLGLKGFDHESKAWSKGGANFAKALRAGVPKALKSFANEPAFSWDATTFVYFAEATEIAPTNIKSGTAVDSQESGAAELLKHLVGTPADYVSHVAEYFEMEIPISAVKHVFDLKPLSAEVVSKINPAMSLRALANDLKEIGYPLR
jgi:hypothetical protein